MSSNKKTQVLLTGTSGFGGSHCLRHLLHKTDWEFICPVSFSHHGIPERIIYAMSKNGVIDRDSEWASVYWDRVTIIKCDISTPINDITSKRIGLVDYVINYASESHVDRSIEEPVPFIRNNIDVVLNLLEFARTQLPGLKGFFLVSTDEVYGPASLNYKHREWDSIIPSNPYSASKAAQEAIGISYWRTFGIPLVIINCMNLIGETQNAEKFVPMIIKKLSNSETVPIHAESEELVGSRFYLHARNLADGILFLINRPEGITQYSTITKTPCPDRWNIVGEKEVNNLEMARMISKIMNLPLKYELINFHSCRPGHDLRYALDGHKLEMAGWTPKVNLEESLEKLVAWTVEQQLWN